MCAAFARNVSLQTYDAFCKFGSYIVSLLVDCAITYQLIEAYITACYRLINKQTVPYGALYI